VQINIFHSQLLATTVGRILYHTAIKVIYLELPARLESSDVCVLSVLELFSFLCSDENRMNK
jgi:hypothetical protein